VDKTHVENEPETTSNGLLNVDGTDILGGPQSLATNGSQDENRIHDLRMTSGSNTVRFFDQLLSAFG
jgi:hypothetical protein